MSFTLSVQNKTNKEGRKEEKEFESEKGMVKDQRHTGVGDGLMKAQWLMCCMPHTTLHSTPSTLWSTPPFPHTQKSGVVKGGKRGEWWWFGVDKVMG